MKPPKQNFKDSVENVDSDETLLAVIKRHPFGIVKMYVQVFVGLGFAALLLSMLLPDILPREENPVAYSIIGIIAVTLSAFMLFILFVATIIYNRSKIVVTDKTITQTIQNGLFNRKISQLAVTNIEDVTAQKNGFFPTVFSYGKLLVETAGEQENFHFDYCPNADHYAKLILEAREKYIENPALNMPHDGRNYAAFQQQQYIAQNQQQQQMAAYQQPPQQYPSAMPGQQPMQAPPQQPQQYTQPMPPAQPQQYQPPADPYAQLTMPPEQPQQYTQPIPQPVPTQPATPGTDSPEQS